MSGSLDLSPFLFAIDRAIEIDDYVDYAEAHSHAQGIGEVLDGIEKLLEQGHAEGMTELAEHVHRSVEEARRMSRTPMGTRVKHR